MSVPARSNGRPSTLLSAIGDLDGWGAISIATGRHPSWCREQAASPLDPMPVHRLHTHAGGDDECQGRCRVFGRSHEIRAWLLRRAGLTGL